MLDDCGVGSRRVRAGAWDSGAWVELRLPIRDAGLRKRPPQLDWHVQHDGDERGRMHRPYPSGPKVLAHLSAYVQAGGSAR
jgi:hypothetical protein